MNIFTILFYFHYIILFSQRKKRKVRSRNINALCGDETLKVGQYQNWLPNFLVDFLLWTGRPVEIYNHQIKVIIDAHHYSTTDEL